jgi:predicted O-methyltransferase YrrM
MTSILNDPKLEALLDRLHKQSDSQTREINDHFSELSRTDGTQPLVDADAKTFLADKFVALDQDKAEFCYALCRSLQATQVIEVGTSYGVSTLYLAAAVRDTCAVSGGEGMVIGTEYEPAKVEIARRNFDQAGLSAFIDLREGDLRETLQKIDGSVDFVLVDIWTPMARPALELVTPRLRRGAIVVCDNTADPRNDYRDYFEFIRTPDNGFRSMTLPFDGGFEFSVKCG